MNECPLSQCPMCGEEVIPEQIDWSMRREKYPFLAGVICGWLGIGGLYLGVYVCAKLKIIPPEIFAQMLLTILP